MSKLSSQIFVALSLSMGAPHAFAQSTDQMNAANNPLQPSIGLNLQDDYTGSYYGLNNADSNSGLLRGTMPVKFFGLPQIIRATLPFTTTPNIDPNGRTSNVGDLNVIDIALAKVGTFAIGFGPQLTIPTAGSDNTGAGKWQAGLAAVVVAPRPWGLYGALITWQTSFAGSNNQPGQNGLQLQPLVIYNLPRGWYLRSTAAWHWDFKAGTHYVPLGFGTGKVWTGRTGDIYNFFAEPQWTVAHAGDGVPHFQLYFGLNIQFPIKQ